MIARLLLSKRLAIVPAKSVSLILSKLGRAGYPPDLCTSSGLRTAVQDARSEGIMTIASSGNDGWIDEISFPACIPEVTSVGAVYNDPHNDLDGDTICGDIDTDDDGDGMPDLWAIYDRSNEAIYGVYDYEADVNTKVDVKDKDGIEMPQAGFDFQIESETEHDQAQFPDSGPVDPGDSALVGPYNAGIQVNSGNLEGAKIFFNGNEPVTPRFGPENELPELVVAAAVAYALLRHSGRR